VRIGDGCATVSDYKLPRATVETGRLRGKAGVRFDIRSQDIGLIALVREAVADDLLKLFNRSQLLRKEKDEARSCQAVS